MRYRGVLIVADYDLLYKGDFRWNMVKTIHEKEVHVPSELVFPFAEKRERDVKQLGRSSLPSSSQLPFAEEAGEALAEREEDFAPPAADSLPKYQLTLRRLVEYGVTPGCKGCESVGTKKQRKHTLECRKRFSKILRDAPLEVVGDKEE